MICRISNLLKSIISGLIDFSNLDPSIPLNVFLKYGGDGFTDGSDYKIIKKDTCSPLTYHCQTKKSLLHTYKMDDRQKEVNITGASELSVLTAGLI